MRDFLEVIPIGRQAALTIGSKFYIGAPCKRAGHLVRFTRDWSCCECHRLTDLDRNHTPERRAYLQALKLRPEIRHDHAQREEARTESKRQSDPFFAANINSKTLLIHACERIRTGNFRSNRLIIDRRVPQEFWFSLQQLHDRFVPLFYGGADWWNYGSFRNGGVWQIDHQIPRAIIMQGTPQRIVNLVLSLQNLRPILHHNSLMKIKLDKVFIAKFREVLGQGAPEEHLIAILPRFPGS